MLKKAYVIGNNVHKSLSPTIFNYWFKKYKVEGEYGFIEIEEKNFENEIIKIFKNPEICGLNITIPYKEKIIPFLSKTDAHSTLIGAVNYITKDKQHFIGGNTDWIGFKNSIIWLENTGFYNPRQTDKKQAVLIGYGGSAKAVIYALEKMSYDSVFIWNRSFDKIKNLRSFGALRIYPKKLETKNFKIKNEISLVVNTIPSKKPYEAQNKNTILNKEKKAYGFDLVYAAETGFLNLFSSSHQINGINLLIHQAAPCFEQWFKVKPEVDSGLVELLLKKLKQTK